MINQRFTRRLSLPTKQSMHVAFLLLNPRAWHVGRKSKGGTKEAIMVRIATVGMWFMILGVGALFGSVKLADGQQ